MKVALEQIWFKTRLLLLCAFAAAALRMFFPMLSLVSFHSLLLSEDGYWFRWLGVPLVNTFWEILTLRWAYLIP